ncbi:MAG TPA: hypothetical protein VI457_13975 [Methylococcaceae bacterium]|nr:hypothetical protein [Methylococcaceae bacterium]
MSRLHVGHVLAFHAILTVQSGISAKHETQDVFLTRRPVVHAP